MALSCGQQRCVIFIVYILPRTNAPFSGQRCPQGEMCCMAHFCPKGKSCSFAKQGRCKFIGSACFVASIATMSDRCAWHCFYVENMHDRSAIRSPREKDSSPPSNAPTSPAHSNVASEHPLSPLTSPLMGGLYLPNMDVQLQGSLQNGGNGAWEEAVGKPYAHGCYVGYQT